MAYDFSKLDREIKETDEWLTKELSGVRTGRASAALLDSIKPEVYGARTPRIIAWDKSNSKAIEKAITDADLGVSVVVDDQGLRVIFPELTAERRTMLVKLAGEKTEAAKITLRGHRAEAIKTLDAAEKEGGMGKDEVFRLKEDIQKKIDAATMTLEGHLKRKQEEIAI
jgi:ribosome recycling factor